eukprot:CAMPEP_0194282738 /NCGR_PEP_ID=MMETSP0169-20130528/23753_1 /TAXON_ID=218684 /ORGANISM="Corethron pennatum, Strain L29A3" /LENGTH=154 /DNA_ID=CAMNT_0039028141 /DNA_START=15 /DNA_END=476 /DNA_ORIENTATION=+
MASSDDSDDEWDTEAIDISILKLKNNNTKSEVCEDGGNRDDNDDEWFEASVAKSSKTQGDDDVGLKGRNDGLFAGKIYSGQIDGGNADGDAMIIADFTNLSDGAIHNRHDKNSVNDSEGASTLRKKIEGAYDTYRVDSGLLAVGTIRPCGSSVW